MAQNFPDAPIPNEQYTVNGVVYVWNGVKWTALGSASGGGGGDFADYMPLAGGTFTGAVVHSGDPTQPLQAATKQYVDAQSGSSVTISDTPPASPALGDLWFDGVSAQMFVWFNDGTSTQWVITVNGAGPPGPQGPPGATGPQGPPGTSGTDPAGVYLPLTGGTITGNLAVTGLAAAATGWFTGDVGVEGAFSVGGGASVWGDVSGWNFSSLSLGPTPAAGDDYDGILYFDGTAAYYECGFLNTNCWVGLSINNGDGTFEIGGGSGIARKIGGGPWSSSSDARIKTVQSDYTPGLNQVIQLRPVVYTYLGNDTPTDDVMLKKGQSKANYDAAVIARPAPEAPYPASPHERAAIDQAQFVGLIAQEVEPVFPGMVTQAAGYIDGVAVADFRTLDTNELIFALVNAVKELTTRIQTLEGAAP